MSCASWRGAASGAALALILASAAPPADDDVAAVGRVFHVVELTFRGPRPGPESAPARDVTLAARFRLEGDPGVAHTVLGFWDGADVYRVRFCPTRPGRWRLEEVASNRPELDGQHEGALVEVLPSEHPGFWVVDDESPGRRWYRRSDGTHPYLVGNTHYTFLSARMAGGAPTGVPAVAIARDVAANAAYFRKLRFSVLPDRYPDPDLKPFLDERGTPSDDGRFANRPNPQWFRQRVDAAVARAFDADLVADLILCGPDTREARATLQADGDPSPYLRYIAARYGSYPNVWLCLSNEYDIKQPTYTEAQVARLGGILKAALPYPTPLSVHPSTSPWSAKFDALPPWNDHQIVQRKRKRIDAGADPIEEAWRGDDPGRPRDRPTINDELSYQGAGDRHTEGDTIEAHLGAFLGGGYGSTGYKSGEKTGQYFWGRFDPAEHTAAPGLRFLRETIDAEVSFWRMSPDRSTFEGLPDGSRVLAWPGHEYALGTNAERRGIVARLPAGTWTVRRHDVIARTSETIATKASGHYRFDSPASRAVLFHFRREAGR
jgi:hypothetical protein